MPIATDVPLVSVITATYNSSATLRLTLQSILQQDFGDFESWVIGDACTDDSEAIVAALNDARLHWFNLPRNSSSQSAPNNEGLRRARGRYIAFVGHDDLWLPWHLSELVRHIEKSGADLVHSLCPLITPAGVIEIIGPPRDGATYAWHFIPPSSWLHRRELAVAIGPWRDVDTLSLGVDFDFIRRACCAGSRIECAPTVSLLKFPSASWGTYAHKGQPPQVAYWEAIQKDPYRIVQQVMGDFAMLYARQSNLRVAVPPRIAWGDLYFGWHRFIKSVGHALLNAYGREREPLNFILLRRFQRSRRRIRRLRGLSM